MLNINRVMITGRLTREPETKYLPSGLAVTNLSMASNRRYQVNDEWREETSFFDVETFGKLAERLGEQLRKGQPVYVEGRLKQESWEKDGQKQSKIRISADSVKAFDVPGKDDSGEGESKQRVAATGRASDGLNYNNAEVAGGNDDSEIPF